MNKYSLNIVWSEEDGGYVATCPEFPGLSAFGETAEEAAKEARIASKLFIEHYREAGKTLPVPLKTSPCNYSGQFRVRIPKSLHEQAAGMALREGVSLNQYVATALAVRVGSDEAIRLMALKIVQIADKAATTTRVIILSPKEKARRGKSGASVLNETPQADTSIDKFALASTRIQ